MLYPVCPLKERCHPYPGTPRASTLISRCSNRLRKRRQTCRTWNEATVLGWNRQVRATNGLGSAGSLASQPQPCCAVGFDLTVLSSWHVSSILFIKQDVFWLLSCCDGCVQVTILDVEAVRRWCGLRIQGQVNKRRQALDESLLHQLSQYDIPTHMQHLLEDENEGNKRQLQIKKQKKNCNPSPAWDRTRAWVPDHWLWEILVSSRRPAQTQHFLLADPKLPRAANYTTGDFGGCLFVLETGTRDPAYMESACVR